MKRIVRRAGQRIRLANDVAVALMSHPDQGCPVLEVIRNGQSVGFSQGGHLDGPHAFVTDGEMLTIGDGVTFFVETIDADELVLDLEKAPFIDSIDERLTSRLEGKPDPGSDVTLASDFACSD